MEFKEPRGIAVDSQGNVWIADTGNNRIQELGSTGYYIRQFGSSSTLKEPQGVAVNPAGDVWIADTGNNRVVEYYPVMGEVEEEQYISSYQVLRIFGASGTGEEQFKEPQGIAVGNEENVYVVDTGNNRIDEYSLVAKHVRNFGKEGTGTGLLKGPHGISVDSAGQRVGRRRGQQPYPGVQPDRYVRLHVRQEGTGSGLLKGPRA